MLDHDGVVRQGLRRRPIASCDRADLPATSPPSPSSTRTVGTDLDLSLDVKDPAAFDRTVAGRPGGRRRGARAPVALPPRLGAGGRVAAGVRRTCAWSTRPASATCPTAPSSGPPRWPTPASTPSTSTTREWTGGLTALFHRFEVLCFGWDAQHDRILDDLLDAGIDGVYSDHVDRMVDALDR